MIIIISNVNWIRYFFQFIKHVLHETSSTHRALFCKFFLSFSIFFSHSLPFNRKLLVSLSFTKWNLFRFLQYTFIFTFCFQHFGCSFPFLFHIFNFFSFQFDSIWLWKKGRKKIRKCLQLHAIIIYSKCVLFFSHPWLISRLKTFSFLYFFFFFGWLFATVRFPSKVRWAPRIETYMWTLHCSIWEIAEKSPFLALICWMTNKIVSFVSMIIIIIIDQSISYSQQNGKCCIETNTKYFGFIRNRIVLVKSKCTIGCDPEWCSEREFAAELRK